MLDGVVAKQAVKAEVDMRLARGDGVFGRQDFAVPVGGMVLGMSKRW